MATGLILSSLAAVAQAEDEHICTNAAYSQVFHDRQAGANNKPDVVLDARASKLLNNDCHATVSAQAEGFYAAEKSSKAGKFPFLGRFPTQHKGDTTGHKSILQYVNSTITVPLGDAVTAVAQGEYSDVAYPGQNEYRLSQAWVIVGDRTKTPVYAAVGKGPTPFGDVPGYATIARPATAHAFQVESEDVQTMVGYNNGKTHVVATAMTGKRQKRTAFGHNSDVLGNFAVNASQQVSVTSDFSVRFGGGYLNDTIYDSSFPSHTADSARQAEERGINGRHSPAWSAFAQATYKKVDVHVEHMRTFRAWQAGDHPVITTAIQGRYRAKVLNKPAFVAVGTSVSTQGPNASKWHSFEQQNISVGMDICPNVTLGVDYVHNNGFVPLIALRQASARGVNADTVIAVGQVRF